MLASAQSMLWSELTRKRKGSSPVQANGVSGPSKGDLGLTQTCARIGALALRSTPWHRALFRIGGALSSVGRASRLHREGRRFEPVSAHHAHQ
jgi:hypothetical protein